MTTHIDLAGPLGNAYALLGLAHQLGKESGLPKEEIDRICKAMQDGTYSDLLDTLVREFPGLNFEFENDPRQPSADDDYLI